MKIDHEASPWISALDPDCPPIKRDHEARQLIFVMSQEPDPNQPAGPETPRPVKPVPRTESIENTEPGEASAPDRRDFLQKAGSIVVGGAIVGCPLTVGLIAVADPLMKEGAGGLFVRLTVLEALPADGVPRPFKVVADKVDAWTTFKDVPLGMVYLSRSEDGAVQAFNASCPHAGCAVEYRNTEDQGKHYYCPCHDSSFNLEGAISSAKTKALRGLDSLEVDQEKLAGGEVWVKFEKFKAGIAEKISVS